MNKHITIIASLLAFFIMLSFSGGYGSVAGSAGTGAPGETGQFCGSAGCHASGAFGTEVEIQLTDMTGDLVTAYEPGENYFVSTVVKTPTGEAGGYGFQMVGLSENNDDVGGWGSEFSAAIQSVDLFGRRYHEHLGAAEDSIFTVPWTAPESGFGAVSFYAVGNAVNRNGSSSGDGAAQVNMVVLEAEPSAVFDLGKSVVEFDISPNPTVDYVNINFAETFSGSYRVYNLVGKVMSSGMINKATTQVNLSNARAGLYLVTIKSEDGKYSQTQRIIKQ